MMSITAINIKNVNVCLLLATALLWVQIEVIAQAVGDTITKPRSANVQRHRANAGCNSDQMTISDYYKVNVLFTFVDHVVQEIDSRFSPRWQ